MAANWFLIERNFVVLNNGEQKKNAWHWKKKKSAT